MKKVIIASLAIILIYGCKKEVIEQPKLVTVTSKDYTIELLNCPGGLIFTINDTTVWNYQLGSNVYIVNSKDSINIRWWSNFTYSNLRVNINGINDYYCNQSQSITYHKVFE